MSTPPDFLILGAQKAGTTALYHFLGQHDDLFLPGLKEPHFFSYVGTEARPTGPGRDSMIVRDPETYAALFASARRGQLRGEASPSYLYVPRAAHEIHRRAPDVRMVAILRQPVDRAYSNYLHAVRAGREDAGSFEEAIDREPQRIREGWGPLWHYLGKGFYDEQIARFHDLFARDALLVILHEDLKADPVATIQRVFRHLGVDDGFAPDVHAVHNASRVPRGPLARALARGYAAVPGHVRERLVPHRLRHAVRDRVLSSPPPLDPELRRAVLDAHFSTSIDRLEARIGRDLTSWRTPKVRTDG